MAFYEEEGFKLQLFARSKYWEPAEKVTTNTTIRRVAELYKAETGVGTNIADIVLISKAKVMQHNKTLGYYGITNERHLITVQFKARGGCFVNGTKILLSNKKRVNIEDVSIGDIVLTYNLNKNKLESFPVKTILKYLVNVLVKITLSNNSEIICTPSHPFYVPNKQNWCCVKPLSFHETYGQLCEGDQLLNDKSELITIKSINYENIDIGNDEFTLVRTLQIDGLNHNYFANNILVHNKMGQKGVDVEKKFDTKTGSNDYHFYSVSAGMNYSGKCETYGCKARGEPVCFKRGFDENGFNPIDENFEEIPKCPGCKKHFELKSYLLYKCDCKVMFKKKGGNKKTLTYKPRGEKVVILGKDKNGELAPEAEYIYFKIWVYKPNTL